MILILNALCILSKIDELGCIANEKNLDLILVTESWCNPEIIYTILKIPGYEIQPDLCRDQENTARYRGRIVGILAGRINYFTNRQ